jgi:hypothetical protein
MFRMGQAVGGDVGIRFRAGEPRGCGLIWGWWKGFTRRRGGRGDAKWIRVMGGLFRHGFCIISVYCTSVNIQEEVAPLQEKSFGIVVRSGAAKG